MTTFVEIDKAGRIVVPKKLRDALSIRAGDQFVVEEIDNGISLQPMYEEVRLVNRDGLLVMVGGRPANRTAVDLIHESRDRRIRYISGELEEP